MRYKLITAAAIAALVSAGAWAQMGPGMMGGGWGYGGQGMGPGMMGGYGMGPGMMGGYGMGPGMMGGYGMGPEMMRGYGPGGYGALNLTDEQRKQVAAIREEFARTQWDLMGKMHGQRWQEFDSSGKTDEGAARKAYQAMADAHKAMFDNSLELRKRIDAVLTKEQREQQRRNWGGG